MTRINKFIVSVVFISTAALIGSASIVHAETRPDWFRGTQDQFQQMVKDKLAEISQVQNKRVCDVATGGNVACTARVVVDSSGRVKANALPIGYGPAQFLGAYDLTGSSTSALPPVIAIVDAYDDPNIASDLSTYSSTYGISQLPTCSGSIATSTSACFEKMNQNGSTSPLPSPNSSWALEISLDVEIAHATCENCSILLVEANSNSFTDLLTAIDTAVANNATAVSGSWGGSEFSGEAAYDSHFNKTGVAFTFSAGDSGYGTLYPAASQYVTAVGGTTLLLSGNSYLSESVWNNQYGGTGSGCSTQQEAKPTWQHDPSCAYRTINDVSADADPATGAAVYDSYGYGGWVQVGGTSLSSPFVAAVYTLHGVPSGVMANSLPYTYGNSSNLNDITTGSNGSCGGSYLCTAQVGYDGPTGLGTPKGTTAFYPTPDYTVAVTPSSQTVLTGTSTSYTVTATPLVGFTGTVTFSVSGLPTGATASFNPPSVTAPGSSAMIVSTASTTPTDTYLLTITGTSGLLSHTATATLIVSTPDFSLSVSPASMTVPAAGGTANYAITIAQSGGFSSAVALSVSGLPAGTVGSFNPNPASGSSSALSITVSSTTIPGSYPITITGVSGALTHTATATLVKQSAQSFSLSASPSSLSVSRGRSGSYKVTVTPAGGFTGSVTLSVSGLPSGTSVSFSTNPTKSSSTLRVNVGFRTPTGTYVLTIKGTSGSLSSTTSVTLTVK